MTEIRIMIVDEDISASGGLKDRLNALGYRVCGFAVSGAEAVQLAENLQPDLIMMKTGLPGEMGGRVGLH